MKFSIYSNLGSEIKKLRKSKNISQKKMAELLEIPYSTYSNYENDNRTPDEETLNRISLALGITGEELLRNVMYSKIGRNIFKVDSPKDKVNILELNKLEKSSIKNINIPQPNQYYFLEKYFNVDTSLLTDSQIDELINSIHFTIKLKLSEFNIK